ncbi:hypothetical protein DL96DRAFT_1256135 [Flagelloscypha sp. PMI_526]|nr:hypothetical protein DL96DRAFT_1256135 [Flagelloscypha sp. PMI_526]
MLHELIILTHDDSERRLRVSGLLHTIHVHSDISQTEPELFRGTAKLIDKTLSKPTLHIKRLTIHTGVVIQPYAIRIFSNFTHSLVTLELQFVNSTVDDLFRSLPADVCCHKLENFTLIYGTGCHQKRPCFHPVIILPMWDAFTDDEVDGSLLESVFDRLHTLLPSTLRSLAFHRLPHRYKGTYRFEQLFFCRGDYPQIKALYFTGLYLCKESDLYHFLVKHSSSLENLTIEGVGMYQTDGCLSQNSLRSPMAENLRELYLTWQLQRLDVYAGDESAKTSGFFVLVDLARTECKVEELNMHVYSVDLMLLRAALLLLHNTSLTLCSNECNPHVAEVSDNPSLWRARTPQIREYRLGHRYKASIRTGARLRDTLESELLTDVKNLDYAFLATSSQEQQLLRISVTKALKDSILEIPDQVSYLDVSAENHQEATVRLVEECLEPSDSDSPSVWQDRERRRNFWKMD